MEELAKQIAALIEVLKGIGNQAGGIHIYVHQVPPLQVTPQPYADVKPTTAGGPWGYSVKPDPNWILMNAGAVTPHSMG